MQAARSNFQRPNEKESGLGKCYTLFTLHDTVSVFHKKRVCNKS